MTSFPNYVNKALLTRDQCDRNESVGFQSTSHILKWDVFFTSANASNFFVVIKCERFSKKSIKCGSIKDQEIIVTNRVLRSHGKPGNPGKPGKSADFC